MSPIALREQDLAVLHRTFERFPFVRHVRLFGSRATGRARRASDIDLAISAPEATSEEWLEFSDAMEVLPIIYEFDLVRAERIDNPRLIEKIAREGVAIYSVGDEMVIHAERKVPVDAAFNSQFEKSSRSDQIIRTFPRGVGYGS
jgi:predicted nucleotidyltransferase